MKRRDFLRASTGAALSARMAAQAGRRPNIVVIVADDYGYADFGAQGATDVATPNIDSIARQGVRFTSGYVSCPVCSPTRAGLMTGRYQQRFGHEFNPGPATLADENFGLPLSEVTIADRLKKLGYATGIVGKWHLGYRAPFHPLKRGFDEFFGFLGGAHSYIDARADKSNPILRGTEPVDEKSYLTDAFTREAVAFIERRRREPFFLYLPYNAVHNPAQAIEKYLARFPAIQDPRRRTFAAMLAAMDDGVGSVLGALRSAGIEENTLVFFVSDNGGPTPANTSKNTPLRGFKAQVLEGGIRVPFLMQWKGRLPAGRVYEQPVISLDILPTAVAAAGGELPGGLDGTNLLPFLIGKQNGPPHQRLYWRFGPQWAIRQGDWKLVRRDQGGPELYNVRQDIGETADVSAAQPARVKDLQAAYDAWNAQLAEPRWRGGRPGRRRRR